MADCLRDRVVCPYVCLVDCPVVMPPAVPPKPRQDDEHEQRVRAARMAMFAKLMEEALKGG